MSDTLTIYSEIGSFFDLRRGILTHLARENGHPNFKWEQFENVYKERRMDYFNRPDLGITNEGYSDRYDKMTIDDWADENECYFYPTNLPSELPQIVRGIEFGSVSTIMLDKMKMVVNLYPFEFSDALESELHNTLAAAFKIPIAISFINRPYEQLTAPYLNNYDYVFKYDLLISSRSMSWFKSFTDIKRGGTKYIVPSLLAKNYSEDAEEALKTVSVEDHIRKCSAVLGGAVIFIPVDKSLYQYIGS